MRDRHALFFELVDGVRHPAAAVPAGARDLAALGYHAVLVTPRRLDDSEVLMLERALRPVFGARFLGIVEMPDPNDPHPLWEAARRFQFDLRRSLFCSHEGRRAGAARIAGIARIVPPVELARTVGTC
ncbi:MAG: hypothetical protein EA398_12775 [Deltaproteobacteria bacterium]|nr:MAG: hypothetical protein EA398_12775 [Deltaproteobacteria bacterium]